MLGHLYYVFGLILLPMTLAILVKIKDYNRAKEWYSKFENVTQRKPKKEDFRTPAEYTLFSGVGGIMVIDFVWLILGLITQSWYVFLFILCSTVVINIIKKSLNINIITLMLSSIVLIVKFLVYLYLIINHFHLHYDTWELIKGQI